MSLRLAEVPVSAIDTPDTAREPDMALRESIVEYGLFIPIYLRARDDARYELVDGSRRLAVTRELHRPTIAALVEPAGEAGYDRDLQALILNRQRQNLQQLFTARHARRLIDQGRFTQAQLARQHHLDRSTLCHMLKVLECADLVAALEQQEIEFGAARALAPLPLADRTELLAELRESAARTGRMPSVRAIEERVRHHRNSARAVEVAPHPLTAVVQALQAAGIPIATRPARQTQLEVTLALAEEDAAWLHDCLAQSPAGSAAPGH